MHVISIYFITKKYDGLVQLKIGLPLREKTGVHVLNLLIENQI